MEIGAAWHRRGLTMRAIGFWSRVDDAIANVTLSSGDLIVRQRQNAARIRAAGAEFELEARLGPSVQLTAASSYVDSTFTGGPLEGFRVPQVPELTHALGLRGSWRALRIAGEWRYIGDQYDDDRNVFVLSASSTVNARVGWDVSTRFRAVRGRRERRRCGPGRRPDSDPNRGPATHITRRPADLVLNGLS